MTNKRLLEHPILGKLEEKPEISFVFDGETYKGYEGDTIASALLANGIRNLRLHEETGAPRGIYCNIGHCYECRVTVDDASGVRACLTEVKDNMTIESGQVLPTPLKQTDNTDELPRTYAEYTEKAEQEAKDQEGDSDV